MPRPRKPVSPFRYFNSSPEVIRLVVMMYVRFPLSLRNRGLTAALRDFAVAC
jgi:putative transposase